MLMLEKAHYMIEIVALLQTYISPEVECVSDVIEKAMKTISTMEKNEMEIPPSVLFEFSLNNDYIKEQLSR